MKQKISLKDWKIVNLVKKIVISTICAGVALSMVSCGSSDNSEIRQYSTGTGEEDTREFKTDNDYSVEFIHTENGDYKCLWHNKGAHYGSMSCEEIKVSETTSETTEK